MTGSAVGDFDGFIDELMAQGVSPDEAAEIIARARPIYDAFDNLRPGAYTIIICPNGHRHIAAAVYAADEGDTNEHPIQPPA